MKQYLTVGDFIHTPVVLVEHCIEEGANCEGIEALAKYLKEGIVRINRRKTTVAKHITSVPEMPAAGLPETGPDTPPSPKTSRGSWSSPSAPDPAS